jgi:hypothetical protein
VPYTMDLNDAVLYRYDAEGEEFARMILDHFETVWREGADIPRVMCIALHPFMMGQPHRIRHLGQQRLRSARGQADQDLPATQSARSVRTRSPRM